MTKQQKESSKEWLKLLDDDKLEDEKKNYFRFAQIILQDILGYQIRDIDFDANNVEFSFGNDSKNIICFEVKGTSTKDLFAIQNRSKKEHSTPIKQTWDYIGSAGLDYGICTNYKYFIMISKQFGYSKYHVFDFTSIKSNEEKLKEFIGVFSKTRIIDKGFIKKISKESAVEERVFTKEFYKLFHETRLMMIMAFEENDRVSRNDAIYFTQLFLNRLIFIFFVADRGFIPDNRIFTNRILSILESGQSTEHSKKICDDIKELFVAFDKGSQVLGVFGFNGGMFSGILPEKIYFSDLKKNHFFDKVKQNSQLSETTELDKKAFKIISKIQNLNPIISNLLIMDSYDFNTEINVNILGHIFEQSISDLETLEKQGLSQQKIDGIYYTPENITDYICRNTIIPYLSKSGATITSQLIKEYSDDVDQLERKLREIKILDPACGSGAFLIKAVDILLEIHKEIQMIKTSQTSASTQLQITHEWDEDKEIRAIIENNIYGVDVNPKSIEITQLSIFLRIASNQRKLIGLSERIQTGNSLIDDVKVTPNALVWEDKFPEVLNNLIENNGFNCIIGNPPWQIVKPNIDEFFSPIFDSDNSNSSFIKLTKIKKNDFVKKCLKDKKIAEDYELYNEHYDRQIKYFNSGSYQHQSSLVNGKRQSSDLNLYKLFFEKSYSLLSKNGLCGLVIPAGIYSDLGCKGLRDILFEKTAIKSLYSFINKQGIFEDVHRQFKFCILIFEKGKNTNKFTTSFLLEDVNKLQTLNDESFDYDVKLVELSSPSSLSIIECSNKKEFDIFKKLYKHPLLCSAEWDLKARSEFHMTSDSKLFHTANIGLPLYEGKMIYQFENNYAKPRYFIDEKEGSDVLIKKESKRMKKINKNYNSVPQIDTKQYRLVWRDVTNAVDRRTLISTILPPNVFLGNTLSYVQSTYFDGEKYGSCLSYKEMLFLCGIFNSFPIDFILRHRVNLHVSIFYLMELPIPRYDEDNFIHRRIMENTARLICTGKEYSDLKKSVGIVDCDMSDEEKKLGLKAQINALSCKLYGLDRDELEFILRYFSVEDEKLKELTLDEFDLIE